MDRAHRIGQAKTVDVYRVIMQDSIEEKILKLQEKKIAVSEAVVNTENSTMFQMGTERLLDIFTLNTTTHNGCVEQSEFDLDALMENYAEDYVTLSVQNFARSLFTK